MNGTNNATGKPLSGLAYLQQSIADILSTPLGSRVMLRDYGSRLYQLVDAPINGTTIVDLYAACVESLVKWQPDFSVSSVAIQSVVAGAVTLTLKGIYTPTGQPVTLNGISV